MKNYYCIISHVYAKNKSPRNADGSYPIDAVREASVLGMFGSRNTSTDRTLVVCRTLDDAKRIRNLRLGLDVDYVRLTEGAVGVLAEPRLSRWAETVDIPIYSIRVDDSQQINFTSLASLGDNELKQWICCEGMYHLVAMKGRGILPTIDVAIVQKRAIDAKMQAWWLLGFDQGEHRPAHQCSIL